MDESGGKILIDEDGYGERRAMKKQKMYEK